MNLKNLFTRNKPIELAPVVSVVVPEIPLVTGIPSEIKPVRGIDPKAQAKLVLRVGERAQVVMVTDTQDSSFLLEDRGEYWLVYSEIRRELIVK